MLSSEKDFVSTQNDVSERTSSSAPHSRSSSWKRKHRGSTREERRMRRSSRMNSVSMPDCSDTSSNRKGSTSSKECPFCTVRSFKTTSKGIIDSGSFSKSFSANSLLSSGSLNTGHISHQNNIQNNGGVSVDRARIGSIGSSDGSEGAPNASASLSFYRTLVLGYSSVGKSSFVQQLTHSNCQDDEDETDAPESGQTVSVELDGHESTMEFIDVNDLSELEYYRADAFLVMYSVSEPPSFTFASNLLNYLRHELGTDRTIFLVANKTDLVRQRLVPTLEAMQCASSNDCQYIEISTTLNVNLDELLVGILCSITRQLTPVQTTDNSRNTERRRSSSSSDSLPRSTSRALLAISNFFRQACRRERRKHVIPIPHFV
ncbi:unnamed protein product [Candidula unifasciata]|uniref:Uncharacterized protein n=1 Tax=Candidula unifasciata TaxID=100452 RepID=A0A8S3YKB9_9EUPU|nr:unnamed protein product [Candidula unifasciata]